MGGYFKDMEKVCLLKFFVFVFVLMFHFSKQRLQRKQLCLFVSLFFFLFFWFPKNRVHLSYITSLTSPSIDSPFAFFKNPVYAIRKISYQK